MLTKMPLDKNKLATAKGLFDSARKGKVWTPRNIILGVLAMLYFISPIDLVPDWTFPLVGWLDDAGIIAAVVYWILAQRRKPQDKA